MRIRLFNLLGGISLACCGCGTSSPPCAAAISLRAISEVDWGNVREDYTEDHFRERTIQLPGLAIKVAGAEVTEIFEHTFRADYDIDLWIFANCYYEQDYLYLVEFKNQRYVFEIVSSLSPVDGAGLPSIGDIIKALRDGKLGKPLDAGSVSKTYVDYRFCDDVHEKGVKLPESFVRIEAREVDLASHL